MHGLPTLIMDLTLITVYAGIVTLLFKWLKQPVVLGYVLAGILAGPYIKGLPTVVDNDNIRIWADIGVIFLLFSLGLEFSFKKIVNVGKAAMITANANIIFMLFIGYNTGLLLGWSQMDSLFLGGMISMSSTTIIIKAFEELNMKKMRFTDLVFGVLVVEDIVGILLLVLLPTVALSKSVNGTELLISTSKLIFFLVFCFIIGIYIVPTFMKKVANYLNDEMLLLIAVALCLGMVVLATSAGFSSALGAFIMGSILAESNVVERIEHVLKPVKDFFGAVFFVSVGMMVNPEMFIQYAWPITVITVLVMVGKIFFSCFGFTLSGQPLRTSILCGFSLAQVGEFAFIIAALGISIGVLSDYVYPIIVAVSVITTFTTPLMIKMAIPFYNKLHKILPESWLNYIERITSPKPDSAAEKNMWNKLFKSYFLRIFIFSIISIGIMNLSFYIFKPLLREYLTGWDNRLFRVVSTALTLTIMAPFLTALLVSKEKVTHMYISLWVDKKSNRIPLILLTSFRILLVVFFVMMVVHQLLTTNPYVTTALVFGSIVLLIKSRWLFNQYMKIETQFLVNLNREQMEAQLKNTKNEARISDEGKWLDSSLFVAQFNIEDGSEFDKMMLCEAQFQELYAINIIKIMRKNQVINVPRGSDKLSVEDALLVAGTERQLRAFRNAVKDKGIVQSTIADTEDKTVSLHDYILTQEKYEIKNDKTILCCAVPVTKDSVLIDETIHSSNIRNKTKCLVVGVERKSSLFLNPKVDFVLKEGDLIWIAGEQKIVSKEVFKQIPLQPVLAEKH